MVFLVAIVGAFLVLLWQLISQQGGPRMKILGKDSVPSNEFEVRNPAIEKKLKDIGDSLRESMPAGYGFALLIVKFGPGGDTFYTSNCDREGMVSLMKEFIAKWEPN